MAEGTCRSCGAAWLNCQAVERLSQGFGKYHGLDAYDLCRRSGIELVRRRDYERFQASLRKWPTEPVRWEILLPRLEPQDATAREGLLIFHEFAHSLILDLTYGYHWSFGDGYRTAEAWCDNFAVAMLLAFCGLKPFETVEAHAFFRTGEGWSQPKSNRGLGLRLLKYCRQAPREVRPNLRSLVLLGRLLMGHR